MLYLSRIASSLVDRTIRSMPLTDALARFNADLLADHSATAVLERYCGAPVRARILPCGQKPLSPEQRDRLQVTHGTEVVYRCVALVCGDLILSEAENWYRSDRLTPAMNAALLSSDMPFGKIVAPLAPLRRTFHVALLNAPPFVLEHRAVLSVAALPLCEVREHYTDTFARICAVQTESNAFAPLNAS